MVNSIVTPSKISCD